MYFQGHGYVLAAFDASSYRKTDGRVPFGMGRLWGASPNARDGSVSLFERVTFVPDSFFSIRRLPGGPDSRQARCEASFSVCEH